MRYPIQLEKTPIIDSVCEFRFQSSQPESVIPVLIANHLGVAKSLRNLPILQIPENIRKQDPNLKYVPLQETQVDGFLVKLSGTTANVSSKIPYVGWEEFCSITDKVIRGASACDPELKYEQIIHRNINFFPNLDILEKLKLKIEDPVDMEPLSFDYVKVFAGENGLKVKVSILNNASAMVSPDDPENLQRGAVIDIEAFWQRPEAETEVNSMQILRECHDLGKKVFFDLLTDEFITEMVPTYE